MKTREQLDNDRKAITSYLQKAEADGITQELTDELYIRSLLYIGDCVRRLDR